MISFAIGSLTHFIQPQGLIPLTRALAPLERNYPAEKPNSTTDLSRVGQLGTRTKNINEMVTTRKEWINAMRIAAAASTTNTGIELWCVEDTTNFTLIDPPGDLIIDANTITQSEQDRLVGDFTVDCLNKGGTVWEPLVVYKFLGLSTTA